MLDSVVYLIEESGAWVYVLAPLFMVAVAILPIPAEIPAMLNGMVFGPLVGALVTWSGGLVGAVVSFELARRFGRPLAEQLVSPLRDVWWTTAIGIIPSAIVFTLSGAGLGALYGRHPQLAFALGLLALLLVAWTVSRFRASARAEAGPLLIPSL